MPASDPSERRALVLRTSNKYRRPSRESRVRATPMMWFAESAHATIRLAAEDPWRYVSLVAGPTTVILVVTKLLKYSVSMSAGSRETSAAVGGAAAALAEHAPMPFLLLGAAFVVAALAQIRFAHLGSVFIPTVVATCAVGGSAVVAVLENPPQWASLGFIEVVRADILVCIGLAWVCAFLLMTMRFARVGVLVALHVITITAAVLAIVDSGYFLRTGSLADSYLLWYALTNLTDLRYVLQHELTAIHVAVILLPVLLSFLPVFVANARSASRVDLHRATPSWRIKRGFVLAGLTASALAFTPAIPLRPTAAVLRPSTPQALLGFVASRVETLPHSTSPVLDIADDYRWAATDSTRPWNVVVVVLESTRARTFGYANGLVNMPVDSLGSRPTVTPFLDSLMTLGLSSRDVSAVVPHTNKALVSVLCGVPPPLNQGRTHVYIPSCLPTLLKQHGYSSAFFTPAKLEFEGKGEMLGQMGFDEAFGDETWPAGDFAILNYFGREDRIVLEPTLKWMDHHRDRASPFLATVLTLVPHHDYGLPPGYPRDSFVADESMNQYLNALRYQDAFLRDLVDGMRRRDYFDDTVLVIVGDHGEAFAEHGLRFHSGVTYQEGLLVPLAILAPERTDSVSVAVPGSQLDILPTLMDLLAFREEGGDLPGMSLMPASSRDSIGTQTERSLFAASWLENQSMSVRRGDRKYIYHFRRRSMEIFDLATDPGEQVDLGPTSTAVERAAVEQELLGWRSATNTFHRQFEERATEQ